MPPCPGTPFAFPPPGAMPALPAVAYAGCGPPGIPHVDLTTGLPNLKLPGGETDTETYSGFRQETLTEASPLLVHRIVFVLRLGVLYDVGYFIF